MLVTPSSVSHIRLVGNSVRLAPQLINTSLSSTTSLRHYAKPVRHDGDEPSGSSSGSSWPHRISTSEAISVHKSGFQAHATSLTAPPDGGLEPLFDRLIDLFPRNKRATHCMYAWRTRQVASKFTSGSTGGSSSKDTIACGSSDGGESGAGERLERLLELSGCQDVVVVVYRWYGGVQLGSERWKCISSVAKEALRAGGFIKTENERQAAEKEKERNEPHAGKKTKKRR